MGIYDTIMLIIMGAAVFIGWRKGMVSQVAAIVSLVASFFVATNFYERVAGTISAAEPWNRIAGFVIVYLGTSLVVWIFFRQIRLSVKRMQLGDFDRQMGGLLGIAKGTALVTIITLVAVNLLTPGPRQAIAQSRSGYLVSHVVHVIDPIMPSRVQQFLAGYVRRLDEVVGTPADPYQTPIRGERGYPPLAEPRYPPPANYPPANYSPTYGNRPAYGSQQYVPPTQDPQWYDQRSSTDLNLPRYE